MRLLKRKSFLVLAGMLLVGVALAAWAFYFEPDSLVVREKTIVLPSWPRGLDGLRVAVASDLHVGAPYVKEEKLRRVVRIMNEARPDLVLLPGDFMIQDVAGGRYVPPEPIDDIIDELRAPLGVYAVLGNHDWWDNGERIIRAFTGAGLRVLENDAARVERDGQALWLVGLADLWTRPQDITGTLAKVTDDAPVVAFTHNPDIFPRIPPRVALTLAGHTHGGQVWLPFVGRAVVPSEYKQRYAEGHVVEGGRHLYVTPGVGTSIYPVRFQVPPEITVLTLRSAPAAP
jgi:predicted MPP superfamily phosphohydrolase